MGAIVLLRALVVLVVIRILGRFVAGVIRGLREPAAGPAPAGQPDMVRDRVCNTFLPRERALTALVHGEQAHFCSPACRDRALAPQPAR
ncbi:MAG TPA: hypothetical protein VFO85_13645 [Vicinamibacteria bacterium]|nr:hypothetical protein [Vicinamibacteria bacterium]